MMWLFLISLLLLATPGILASPRADPGSRQELEKLFREPPADRRVLKIIHNFPPEAAARDRLIQTLIDQGFGGVVCNVHFKEYLRSESLWTSFQQAVRKAKAAGLHLWLYDEEGYPSAGAGGLTLEGHPEWEALGLYIIEADAAGVPVGVALRPGQLRAAWACPAIQERVDLSRAIDIQEAVSGSHLRWTPPEGQWKLFVYIEAPLYTGTHAENNLHAKRPYPNIMQKEPITRFLELTHQAYARHFPDLNEMFEAIFTDEPSLMNVFLRPQPHPALPWSPTFAAIFRQRRGYDLMPKLPALTVDIGPETGRIRCDFWKTVGELVAENYFGQIQEWCHAHKIASTGHHLWEEGLSFHVGFYGDFFAGARRYDIPGIDCLTSDPPTVPWQIAKMMGSVADLCGRSKTMSETSDHSQHYRPAGDTRPVQAITPEQIKGTCNRLYVAGINTTTSYYSWAGLADEQIRQINSYVGRCGAMLSNTRHLCDIAVYYPIETCWTHFVPATHLATRSREVLQVERAFQDISERLFRAQRDFDYVDGRGLTEARVEGNAFHIRERYRVLILPWTETIPQEAWEKAAGFVRSGGAVVALGTLPVNSLSDFPSDAIKALTAEIFGAQALQKDVSHPQMHRNSKGGVGVFLPAGSEIWLPAVLNVLLEPDLAASTDSPLRYTHRHLMDGDAYYIINDSPAPVEESVSLCGRGEAHLWDPEDGSIRPLGAERDGKRSRVHLKLSAYGAAFVVFPEFREPDRHAPESLPMLRVEAVPLEKIAGKTAGRALGPEHVRIEQKEDPLLRHGNATPLRVEAELLKGNTDSWCFVVLSGSGPMDLSGIKGLQIDTWVPAGQSGCQAVLLAVLHEAGGGDYLANCARPLSQAGWQTSTVWVESFAPAGWSQDPDGRLDLSRIERIHIGWGGYFGNQNERIIFALGPVRCLRSK